MIMREDVSLQVPRAGLAALGVVALLLVPAWARGGAGGREGGGTEPKVVGSATQGTVGAMTPATQATGTSPSGDTGAGTQANPRVDRPPVPYYTLETARMAVQLLALKSPNPFVREMAYHEHDADWAFDLWAGTFAVKIAGLQGKVYTGTFQPTAAFDDEAGLSKGWIVPADALLSLEEANRCLAEMGQRLDDPRPRDYSTADASKWFSPQLIKTFIAAMKGVETKVDARTGQITGSGTKSQWRVGWSINLSERTFDIWGQYTIIDVATQAGFTGRFGWDKDRKWTAWPIEMRTGSMTARNGANLGKRAAVPEEDFTRAKPVTASSAVQGHAAGAANDGTMDTFWQPAENDAHPTWTIDLKTSVTISRIRIMFIGNSGFLRPVIEVSDDQKTWQQVADNTSGGALGTFGVTPVSLEVSLSKKTGRPFRAADVPVFF